MRSPFAVGVAVTLKVVVVALLLWNINRSPPVMSDPPAGCADENYQTECDTAAWRAWQADNSAQRREFQNESRLITGGMVLLFLASSSTLWFGLSPARRAPQT